MKRIIAVLLFVSAPVACIAQSVAEIYSANTWGIQDIHTIVLHEHVTRHALMPPDRMTEMEKSKRTAAAARDQEELARYTKPANIEQMRRAQAFQRSETELNFLALRENSKVPVPQERIRTCDFERHSLTVEVKDQRDIAFLSAKLGLQSTATVMTLDTSGTTLITDAGRTLLKQGPNGLETVDRNASIRFNEVVERRSLGFLSTDIFDARGTLVSRAPNNHVLLRVSRDEYHRSEIEFNSDYTVALWTEYNGTNPVWKSVYSDYASMAGCVLPQKVTITIPELLREEVTLISAEVNVPLPTPASVPAQ
jgi:hypothetical protein